MDFVLASLIVIGVTLLGALSPGPDTALLLKNSLLGSRTSAFFTILGIVTGNTVYVFVALAGVGLLLTQSGLVYVAVQALGALYLMYLGARLFMSKPSAEDVVGAAAVTPRAAYVEGLITNLLNPKFVLFVLALFTQVIMPEWSLGAKLFLGMLIPASAFVSFSFLVLVLTRARVRAVFTKSRHLIERVMGVALVSLGVKVLTSIHR